MALSDDFADALLENEDVEPQVFTYAGTDYPCFAASTSKTKSVQNFGMGVDLDLVIIVRANLFSSPPISENVLTYRGTRYRIKPVMTAAGASFLRLGCKYDSMGA